MRECGTERRGERELNRSISVAFTVRSWVWVWKDRRRRHDNGGYGMRGMEREKEREREREREKKKNRYRFDLYVKFFAMSKKNLYMRQTARQDKKMRGWRVWGPWLEATLDEERKWRRKRSDTSLGLDVKYLAQGGGNEGGAAEPTWPLWSLHRQQFGYRDERL